MAEDIRDKVVEEARTIPGAIVMHSNRWKYPSQGDDARTSDMLDFMLKSEQRSGYLIYIPTKKIEGGKVL